MPLSPSRLVRLGGALALCLVFTPGLALSLARPAAADNVLESSSPADGTVLPVVPDQIVLTFGEPLTPESTTVTVKGPDLQTLPATVRVAGATATVVVGGGPPGNYRVNYRVNSADGHPATGGIRFTVGNIRDWPPAPVTTELAPTGHRWAWPIATALTVLAVLGGILAVRRSRKV